ncbi:putative epoxide hydrolase [Colletotrichum higginsianum]|uniref:Putative epoxide hydrolase n=1 Tax=Colletotrichum higginsianum TaxID=80884 RepID=A0A4V4NCF5_9PEZI|nr:putative epoxide hydrolase [Colletotrichum higginsianum]
MPGIQIQDFKVDIPAAEVERLQRKLRDTRLPGKPVVPDAGPNYGPEYQWAENLYNAWTTDFNWYDVQEEMNQVPHHIATIEDLQIHFVHARSDRLKAIPLLAVHGWPGSFWEFSQVWGPLSNPTDPNDPAFHVVAPSMPGFCWSSWPPRSGWKLQDNARVFDKLMKGLGYNEYMVQCGDWGHFVGRELGSKYTDSCKLVHCNFAPSPMPDGAEYTDREKRVAERGEDWLQNHIGYAVAMRTRPHTIGIALHDNPMGTLMWVGEKYNEAANPENQAKPFWTKAILTTVSLYFFTGCILPSMLPYYESPSHEDFNEFVMQEENRIRVPFGYTSFLFDTEPASRRAVERTGDLVFYRERDNAGHFAALEHPDGLMQDVRDLVKQSWKPVANITPPAPPATGLRPSSNRVNNQIRPEYRSGGLE